MPAAIGEAEAEVIGAAEAAIGAAEEATEEAGDDVLETIPHHATKSKYRTGRRISGPFFLSVFGSSRSDFRSTKHPRDMLKSDA